MTSPPLCRPPLVTSPLGCRRALAPLVERGYVDIVYGGGGEGAFLSTHPLVGSILLTGSAATYDAIVWGNKDKREARPSPAPPPLWPLGAVPPAATRHGPKPYRPPPQTAQGQCMTSHH